MFHPALPNAAAYFTEQKKIQRRVRAKKVVVGGGILALAGLTFYSWGVGLLSLMPY